MTDQAEKSHYDTTLRYIVDTLRQENERLKVEVKNAEIGRETNYLLAQDFRARAEQAEQRYQNACEALRIETEEADALERKLEQAEATLERVTAGLTRERIAEVLQRAARQHSIECASLDSSPKPCDCVPLPEYSLMADAILALLAPEGNP